MEETFKDVKGILRLACWKVFTTYANCEMDELMAEASLLYVRYFDHHPPQYDFGLWIYFKVLYCLVDRKRVECRRSQRMGMVVYHAVDFAESYKSDWTDSLVAEDMDVVQLALRLPRWTTHSQLKNKLLGLGWEPQQIKQSFKRIKEAYSCQT